MKKIPTRLGRYKNLIHFLLFELRPAFKHESTDGKHATTDGEKGSDDAQSFARSLKNMGPTFVKFGQLLSTRNDLLTEEYIEALQHLQDDLEPFAYEAADKVFTEEFGIPIKRCFGRFEEQPLAAASLGQTHRAFTREGAEVAVKIQRPGISEQIEEDLDVLSSVAEFVENHSETVEKYGLCDLVNQFKQSIRDELDYKKEAKNLEKMVYCLYEYDTLTAPLPHNSFCSSRVLTMDYISGVKITEISDLVLTQIDGEKLVDDLIDAYLRQFIIEGFFHADPHPGNIVLTPNHKIAFMDWGMVGRLSKRMGESLLQLFSGICQNRSERVVDVVTKTGLQENHTIDRKRLDSAISRLIAKSQDATIDELQFGTVVMRIIDICAEHGVKLPPEFNMVGKALLNLDQIAMALAPKANLSKSVKKKLRSISIQRSVDSTNISDAINAMVEMKELFQKAPHRINTLLDNLAENKFRVNTDVIDEVELLQGLQKIANRITLGAIVAAMVIGAALIMQVDSQFQLLGYSGLAVVLLAFALLLGGFVVFSILKNDH